MERETIRRTDFQVQQVGPGQWQVTYTRNGHDYTGTTNDAELIDAFKQAGAEPWVNEEDDSATLVRLAGVTGAPTDERGRAFEVYKFHVIGETGDLSDFDDAYIGRFNSLQEYAWEVMPDLFPIPKQHEPYLMHNVDQYVDDLEREGYVCIYGYLFRPV